MVDEHREQGKFETKKKIRHEDAKRACRNPLKSIHTETQIGLPKILFFSKATSNERRRGKKTPATTTAVAVVFVKTMQAITKESNKIPKSNST